MNKDALIQEATLKNSTSIVTVLLVI